LASVSENSSFKSETVIPNLLASAFNAEYAAYFFSTEPDSNAVFSASTALVAILRASLASFQRRYAVQTYLS
jgi:hypothetical protein